MSISQFSLARLSNSLGTHLVPDPAGQERERARTRNVVYLGIALVWLTQYTLGRQLDVGVRILFAVGFVYGTASLILARLHEGRGTIDPKFLLATLILDPVLLVAVLIFDPHTFAFLNPFVLFVVVRSGIRYGVRSLYVSWWATVWTMPWLFLNPFWSSNIELTFSFFALLAFVPLFFTSLIQRIHHARKVEEERARLQAMNEIVIARSAFLAKVSHELRSPLQSIVSALDVFEMRHGHQTVDDAELIGKMRRSSLLLNTHLRDLLTLARGEAGRLEIRPETFEVCALLEGLAESARELAHDKGLEVRVHLPISPVFVVADASRIDQVLTNLVLNSIQYTESGQVRIAFSGYDVGTRKLRLEVADTGSGIPAGALPTLFAPDKLLTGTERKGQGSGLGLAIVRTLVDQLGGTIAVTSREGEGTVFSLEIPAELVEGDARDTLPSDETGRILIVDDREDILDALSSVVDELGFECHRASSAAIGANLLAARRYDAVLIDIDMPVKSGADLAAETKRGNGPNRETRFIGMSAADSVPDAENPFDLYLTKPIDHGALRRALLGSGQSLSRPSQPGLWIEEGGSPSQ